MLGTDTDTNFVMIN